MISVPGYNSIIMDGLDNALKAHNQIMRPRVVVYDAITGRIKMEITKLISGDITVDTPLIGETSSASRKLTCSFYRPNTYFSVNSLWINDLYKVFYEVYVPELDTQEYGFQNGGYIPIPVFAGILGPGSIGKSELNNDIIEISAFGYEQRYMTALGSVRTVSKNVRYTSAMQNIISHYNHQFLDYTWPNPDGKNNSGNVTPSGNILRKELPYGSKISKEASTGVKSDKIQPETPWNAIRKLALGCGGWNVFFDSNFRFNARPVSTVPVKIYSKTAGNMLDFPKENVDFKSFVNFVVVWGEAKEGQPQIRGEADAKVNYSKSALQYCVTEEIQESTVQTQAAANALARNKVNELFALTMNISFGAVTEPRLQEGDYIQVENPDGAPFIVPLVSFTIPLTPDKTQEISSSRRKRLSRIMNLRRKRRNLEKRRV